MWQNLYPVLGACVVSCLFFSLIGMVMHGVAVRKARPAFRAKGYLKPPAGRQWVHFLTQKHYDAFEDSGTRFYFSGSRFCMIAIMISLLITGVFVGCALLLQYASGSP